MRQVYGCHCEGHPGPQDDHRPTDAPGVAAWSVLGFVEEITGCRPPTCPWAVYEEPVVLDVLRAYRSCTTGWGVMPAAIRSSNPPRYVWDGLHHYVHSVNLIRGHDDEQRDKHKKRR